MGDFLKKGQTTKLLLIAAYGIFSLILSIQTYKKFTYANQACGNIIDNLSQSFITDVKVIRADQCPDGYNSIFEWDWKGIKAGCYWQKDISETSYEFRITEGECDSTGNGYENIPSCPETKFSGIKGYENEKEIVCVKRTGIKFSDIIADQTGSCSENQKMCGNPDQKEFVICVASSDPCPIYSIQRSFSNLLTKPNEWKEMKLASGKSLYINYNGFSESRFPLSEHRFTQYGVCKLNNKAKQLPPNDLDFDLMVEPRQKCIGDNENEIDDSFSEIDFQIDEKSYYKLNLHSCIWKMKYISGLNSTSEDNLFKLFVRQFIPWKIEARHLVKPFIETYEGLQSLDIFLMISMLISILVCLHLSIIVPIIKVAGIYEGNLAIFIAQGIQLPILVWILISTAQKKKSFNEVATAKPSEARYNFELQTCSNQLDENVFQNYLIILQLLIGTIIMEIQSVIQDKMTK